MSTPDDYENLAALADDDLTTVTGGYEHLLTGVREDADEAILTLTENTPAEPGRDP